MRTVLLFFVVIIIVLSAAPQPVSAGEVMLRNGNKIDYGPTWEKDGMVYFYFHDYGVAGISKNAIVGNAGLLGELRGDYFVSEEYNCKIGVPRGWHAANAIDAIDLMPIDEKRKQDYQELAPEDAMKKMGFLVILYETRPWDKSTYNPRIVVTVQDLIRYPGVKTPVDFLTKSEMLLTSKYSRFQRIKKPTAITIDGIPAARHKFSYNVVIDNKPLNLSQWEYAFISKNKIYSVSAIDTTKEFRSMEKHFVQSLNSFRFLN